MPTDRTDRVLNEIGQLLSEDAEYPLDGTLLYAELDENFVRPSIFKDGGDRVIYRRPDNRLGRALLDLWRSEDAINRWTEIEYVIRNGKFDASFAYAEDIDPDEEPLDRRARIVAKHFGDKPIVYPPPSGDHEPFDL